MSAKKRRVVVTDSTFPDLQYERAAALKFGADFVACQCKTADEVTAAIDGADIALVQFAPFTAQSVERLTAEGGIIRYGIGYDNIDIAAALRRNLHVGYIPDYCTAEVADHTAALILASLRKLMRLDASVRAGQWSAVATAQPIKPFDATTIGFLGLGRIGSLVLARLRPFGFRFVVADPQLSAARAEELGVESVTSEQLLARADVLSLHAPASADTIHIIDERALRSMRSNAIIVNTARGKLIDEAALARALADGVVAGAALDVFEEEPLPDSSALRTAPNVTFSPHAAWYSDAAIVRLQTLAAEDLERLLSGRPPRCPVPGSF